MLIDGEGMKVYNECSCFKLQAHNIEDSFMIPVEVSVLACSTSLMGIIDMQ